MYTKKMLSAVTAVAIISSVAISFDMIPKNPADYNKENISVVDLKNYSTIIVDRLSAKDENATYLFDQNRNVTAIEDMKLSNDFKGDALIYPAFRIGEDQGEKGAWETEITVRNVKPVSVIAKAVLYDANDTHELQDFNLYLSSHDVARFKIKSGKNDEGEEIILITTRDGSIIAGLDESLQTTENSFVVHEDPSATKHLANLDDQLDKNDSNAFIISKFPAKHPVTKAKINSGYVVIYVMVETEENTEKDAIIADYYHGQHEALYQAYYHALEQCRPGWQDVFSQIGGTVKNGTATGDLKVNAPNVKDDCEGNATIEYINEDGKVVDIYQPLHFKSPSDDILFGEVSISKYGSDDPRSLLLRATAIKNYTDDSVGQIMLWSPNEYAAIQDRRITMDVDGDGLADYNNTGIANDALDMVRTHGYFTFNKKGAQNYQATMIVTQPMKRALGMAGHGEDYWQNIDIDNNRWGMFSLKMDFYDENENQDKKDIQLVTFTSPANSADEKLYEAEMAPLKYEILARGANSEKFKNQQENGYADVSINPKRGKKRGLPCIITQMTSQDVDGEAQINWIYSATER